MVQQLSQKKNVQVIKEGAIASPMYGLKVGGSFGDILMG